MITMTSTRVVLFTVVAAVAGSLFGFFLLGISTHSGGLIFLVGNVLMPGVFLAGVLMPSFAKGLFWVGVAIVQILYYVAIGFVFWLIRSRNARRLG